MFSFMASQLRHNTLLNTITIIADFHHNALICELGRFLELDCA